MQQDFEFKPNIEEDNVLSLVFKKATFLKNKKQRFQASVYPQKLFPKRE